MALEHFPWEKGLGELGWVLQEKRWLQGQLIALACLQGVIEEVEPGLTVVWCVQVRENKYRLSEVHGRHKEEFFFSVPMESEAVEQVTLRGCTVSVLRGYQPLTGARPEQPGLSLEL